MTRITLSEAALRDFSRISDFLAAVAPEAATRAGTTLADSIAMLKEFPLLVPALDGKIRILSVPFGKRGYSVAYVYEQDTDEVIVLGIKHQREEYFPFEVEGHYDE